MHTHLYADHTAEHGYNVPLINKYMIPKCKIWESDSGINNDSRLLDMML
jgi:hypothetical protein